MNKLFDRLDWILIFILALFLIISFIAITSAQTFNQYNENFAHKQLFWYGIGIVIITAVITLNSEQQLKLSWAAYFVGILLLVFLFVAPESIAPKINGAKSWFVIKKIGSLQPSELVKVSLIMALSKLLVSHHEKYMNRTLQTDFLLLIKMGLTTALPLGIILLQPDLGTGLVIIAILAGMIIISGISWKITVPLFTTGVLFSGAIIYFIIWMPELIEKYLKVKTYQFLRIYAWIHPEEYQTNAGMHVLKSLDAIGSGVLTGKGFGQGQVYIPENHTDFIFSVIGEEYGFIGTSIVISLFFLLIYHLTTIALKTIIPYQTYICVGIISMITFHVFQNIGMTIQLLPITGIPLPFISYGGSSLMGNMLAMGLIFSIHFHHKGYLFHSK